MQVDTTVLGLDAKRAKEMPYIASMGIYVVSKEAMTSLLRNEFPEANDFGSEVIPGATKLGMNVQAYLYGGYWEDIGTVEAFYNANLGITKKPVPDFRYTPGRMSADEMVIRAARRNRMRANYKRRRTSTGRFCTSYKCCRGLYWAHALEETRARKEVEGGKLKQIKIVTTTEEEPKVTLTVP